MYVTRQNRVQRPPREMTGMGEAQSSSAVTRMVVPRGVSLNVTRAARIAGCGRLPERCSASISPKLREAKLCTAVRRKGLPSDAVAVAVERVAERARMR